MQGLAESTSSFQTSAAKLRADLVSRYQPRFSAPDLSLKAVLPCARSVSRISDLAMALARHTVWNDGIMMASQNGGRARP